VLPGREDVEHAYAELQRPHIRPIGWARSSTVSLAVDVIGEAVGYEVGLRAVSPGEVGSGRTLVMSSCGPPGSR